MATKKLRVVQGFGPISIWKTAGKRPEPFDDPEQWLSWEDGEEFTPPAHFNVERALERGIVEEVKRG